MDVTVFTEAAVAVNNANRDSNFVTRSDNPFSDISKSIASGEGISNGVGVGVGNEDANGNGKSEGMAEEEDVMVSVNEGSKKRRRSSTSKDSNSRKFPCTWEGCGKVFSRPDHLSRHRLNHTPSQIYNCDRCSKVFVRADLLIRHAERHDRREREAQAVSAQFANIPRINNSSIINNSSTSTSSSNPASIPPTLPNNNTNNTNVNNLPSQTSNLSNVDGSIPLPPIQPIQVSLQPGRPPNDPLKRIGAYGQVPVGIGVGPVRSSPTTSTSVDVVMTSSELASPATNALPITFSPSATQIALFSQPPGQPQPLLVTTTASGVPVVVTTAGTSIPITTAAAISVPIQSGPYPHPYGAGPLPVAVPITIPITAAPPQPIAIPLAVGSPREMADGFYDPFTYGGNNDAPFASAIDLQWLLDGIGDMEDPSNPHAARILENFQIHPNMFENNIQAIKQQSMTTPPSVEGSMASNKSSPCLPYMMEPVPDEAPLKREDPSTHIDPTTFQRIIEYLSPALPEIVNHPKLTPQSIQLYLHLYWRRVHETQFPIIHKATFKTETTPTPLLCSMFLFGCFYADLEAHKMAKSIHEKLRGMIICSDHYVPRADIWVFQAVLLCIIFGKMCSDRKAHEMSHIFWGSVVTLARRSALFSPKSVAEPESTKDKVDARWRAWIAEESAKRCAFSAFLLDVEHAAIFRHTPTLSAFQLQLTLPSDESVWTSTSFSEWNRRQHAARPPMPFISALKASMIPGHSPPVLNAFSRILILHGLMSVSFDMQWRDHFMLGIATPDGPNKDWREMMSAAYNCWKARLDTSLINSKYPDSQLLRSSISMYAIAHIVQGVDVHELQIWAGAERALGLAVAPAVIEATKTRIFSWSSTKEGRQATWHSAHFLRSTLLHRNQTPSDLSSCFHFNWSMYISTLTLYAYSTSIAGPPRPGKGRPTEEALAYLDALCTQSPDILPQMDDLNGIAGLLHTIWELIKDSRWEIAEEGGKIVKSMLDAIDDETNEPVP